MIGTPSEPADEAARQRTDLRAWERGSMSVPGRLDLEEFLAHQRDVPAAQTRFEKWDANQDGFLMETEFVREGSVRTAPGDNQ